MNKIARIKLTWVIIVGGVLIPALSGLHGAYADTIKGKPTAGEARAFMESLEKELLDLLIASERSEWVKTTYITHDTDLIAARANEALMGFVSAKAD